MDLFLPTGPDFLQSGFFQIPINAHSKTGPGEEGTKKDLGVVICRGTGKQEGGRTGLVTFSPEAAKQRLYLLLHSLLVREANPEAPRLQTGLPTGLGSWASLHYEKCTSPFPLLFCASPDTR